MRSCFLKFCYCIAALLCMAGSAAARNGVVLWGHISSTMPDTVKVTYSDNYLAYYPKDFYTTTDKKGNFSLSFPVPKGYYLPAEIQFQGHIAEVILHDGDSLQLSVVEQNFDSSIHYAGTGSAIQNFIARHTIEKGRMNQYANRAKAAIEKEPAAFIKTLESEKKAELDFMEQHKKGLPQGFVSYWRAYYQYYNYFFIEQYPQIHEVVRLKRYTDTVPEANYKVIDELPYSFNDSLMQLPPYLLYLGGLFEIKLKAAGYTYKPADSTSRRVFADSLDQLGYKKMTPKSAEYYIAQNIYSSTRTQPLQRTHGRYSTFRAHWPNSEYLPLMDKQIALTERLAPGQPAPDFDITTADGKRLKLSDLRGKVVYLGFWATWCRQCVGEMISEAKTKEVLKNKSIAFVYASLDNDTTTAMRVVRKYKIDGIFHFLTGGWAAPEIQQYGVQGLPAYYIIDKEGKIAVQNAPTPMQSTELIVALSRAL